MFKRKMKREGVLRGMTREEWNEYIDSTYTPKYVTVCGERIAIEEATTDKISEIVKKYFQKHLNK